MHTSELLKHIYDINLSYLLLAQRLIVQDKASAMFRLGINEEMATTLAALTLPQWLSWQKPISWFVTSVLTATRRLLS